MKPSIEQNPGPTEYDVKKKKKFINPCHSSFVSTSKKCNYINTNINPGAGTVNN